MTDKTPPIIAGAFIVVLIINWVTTTPVTPTPHQTHDYAIGKAMGAKMPAGRY